MRKGILSLSLPGLRRPTPARRSIQTTPATAQPPVGEPVAAIPTTPWSAEPNEEDLPTLIAEPSPEPVQEAASLRPRTSSMMKAVLKRHEEIANRVHKKQEEIGQQ